MNFMKKGSQRGAWSSGDSGGGMLRYEEGLLVESSSEQAPLAFRGRGEGGTVVHMGRDVTGGS